jgi:hypothetical protein
MKLTLTKDWFTSRAAREGDVDIAAGLPARRPSPEDTDADRQSLSEVRPAVSQTMRRWRLKKHGSVAPRS